MQAIIDQLSEMEALIETVRSETQEAFIRENKSALRRAKAKAKSLTKRSKHIYDMLLEESKKGKEGNKKDPTE